MKTMKTVLAIILLATFSMNSQGLKKDYVDEITGSRIKVTKIYEIGKGRRGELYAYATSVEGHIALSFFNFGNLCAGAVGNYITFKFSDGTNLIIEDEAEVSCKETASSWFRITDLKDELLNKEIVSIRFRQQYAKDYKPSGDYTIQQIIELIN